MGRFYIRMVVSATFIKTFFLEGYPHAFKVIRGLPIDAELIHSEYDHDSRSFDFYFTSDNKGTPLSEGALLSSLPRYRIEGIIVKGLKVQEENK